LKNTGRTLGKIIFAMRVGMNKWGDKKNNAKDNANQCEYFPGLEAHVSNVAS
jgi:hypothetical protein